MNYGGHNPREEQCLQLSVHQEAGRIQKYKGEQMNKLKTFLGLAGILIVLATAGCATTPKSDLTALQGKWTGRELGQNTEGTREMIFTGNIMEFRGGNENDWAKGSFILREETTPHQIQYVIMDCPGPRMIGAKGTAIYKLEGNRLSLTGYAPGDPTIPPAFDAPGARHFELKKN